MSRLTITSPTLAVLAVGLVGRADAMPRWSWDTIQTYVHCANFSGEWNPQALKVLAAQPFVVFEKCNRSRLFFRFCEPTPTHPTHPTYLSPPPPSIATSHLAVLLPRHSHKQGESRAFTSALVMGRRGFSSPPPPFLPYACGCYSTYTTSKH